MSYIANAPVVPVRKSTSMVCRFPVSRVQTWPRQCASTSELLSRQPPLPGRPPSFPFVRESLPLLKITCSKLGVTDQMLYLLGKVGRRNKTGLCPEVGHLLDGVEKAVIYTANEPQQQSPRPNRAVQRHCRAAI